ncbi:hypothetical protein [Pseudoalteromonas sp. PAR1]|jgi:hypothetical protein|uniref:hypothetical protein n=1 Tax=unclassified Pseudoalteromonas TaxID=194690 RepID=UPI00110974D4|nr:hypothetical protein [Pseudoalteromonas sp. PAR1]TMO36826.1 hypothetical protein CWC25_22325 [Pseudoalteromonas sp. S4389]
MQPRLELEFLQDDPSKIWVKACNERFAGETEQYFNAQSLRDLAENLSSFPKSNSDEIIFEVGEVGSSYGHCFLKFYCIDSAGHTAVFISVSDGESNSAKFTVQFEVLSLDMFVSSINFALKSGNGVSELIGINAYTQNI